jgi:hypothetical protein
MVTYMVNYNVFISKSIKIFKIIMAKKRKHFKKAELVARVYRNSKGELVLKPVFKDYITEARVFGGFINPSIEYHYKKKDEFS